MKLPAKSAIDLQEHALLCSSLVRLSARVGINRVPKNVTPSLNEYVASDLDLRDRGCGMTPTVSIRKALSDPNLLGTTLAGDTWSAWRTLLVAMMGEQLTDDEREVFKSLTGGREREPLQRVDEFAAVVGRRGKSRSMSTLACYLAGLCDHPMPSCRASAG